MIHVNEGRCGCIHDTDAGDEIVLSFDKKEREQLVSFFSLRSSAIYGGAKEGRFELNGMCFEYDKDGAFILTILAKAEEVGG